jgi:hypothetical protein
VLIAMDETHTVDAAADLAPLDLALLPIGVFEHHPYSASA